MTTANDYFHRNATIQNHWLETVVHIPGMAPNWRTMPQAMQLFQTLVDDSSVNFTEVHFDIAISVCEKARLVLVTFFFLGIFFCWFRCLLVGTLGNMTPRKMDETSPRNSWGIDPTRGWPVARNLSLGYSYGRTWHHSPFHDLQCGAEGGLPGGDDWLELPLVDGGRNASWGW